MLDDGRETEHEAPRKHYCEISGYHDGGCADCCVFFCYVDTFNPYPANVEKMVSS